MAAPRHFAGHRAGGTRARRRRTRCRPYAEIVRKVRFGLASSASTRNLEGGVILAAMRIIPARLARIPRAAIMAMPAR